MSVNLPANNLSWHPVKLDVSEAALYAEAIGGNGNLATDEAVTGIFLSKLKKLEDLRPGINSCTISHQTSEEIRDIFEKTHSFINQVKSRAYAARKTAPKFAAKFSAIQLKLHSLKQPYSNFIAGSSLVSNNENDEIFNQRVAISQLILGWTKEVLIPLQSRPFHSEDLKQLEKIYQDLPDEVQEEGKRTDKEIMLSTIEAYKAARKQTSLTNSSSSVLLGADHDLPKSVAAANSLQSESQEWTARIVEQLEDYPEFMTLLLESNHIQALFKKQVLRDNLPIEIFIEHPFVAEYLRNSESLEKSIAIATARYRDEGIRLQPSSNHLDYELPHLRVNGRWVAVRDLTDFDSQSVKTNNLMGWHTLGMGRAENSLKNAYRLQNQLFVSEGSKQPKGFVYTAKEGLVHFNPRTWSSFDDQLGVWKPIDMNQKNWWNQLPAYASEEVELTDLQASGWSIKTVVSHSQDIVQLGGTHAYLVVGIPDEIKEVNGKRTAKINYYPFGTFAHFFEGNSKAVKTMSKEVHYIDQDFSTTDRARTERTYELTQEQGLSVMEKILQERLETLQQAGIDVNNWEASIAEEGGPLQAEPDFKLHDNNCGNFVRRVVEHVNQNTTDKIAFQEDSLPLQVDFNYSLTNPFLRFLINIIRCIPILKNILLWILGGSGETYKWNLVLNNCYTLRVYSQLKNETEELQQISRLTHKHIAYIQTSIDEVNIGANYAA